MKSRKLELYILIGITLLAGQGAFADGEESAEFESQDSVSEFANPENSEEGELTGVPGQAAGEVGGMSTVSTEKSLYDKISERALLTYFGVYRGAPLTDLRNSHQPRPDGEIDMGNPQSFENLITAGYRFNKNLMLGATMHFNYFPVGYPVVGTGHTVQMLDPGLILERKNWINSNGFKLTGRLTAQLPVTTADALRPNGLLTAIAPTVILNYEIPGTNFSIGCFSYIKAYIPGTDPAPDALTYKLYVAPTANYQITKTVAATLWVDLIQATRRNGTGFFSGIQNAVVDIEPGINWDITPNISINPILNIYPGNFTLASTSIQAFIVAKAF